MLYHIYYYIHHINVTNMNTKTEEMENNIQDLRASVGKCIQHYIQFNMDSILTFSCGMHTIAHQADSQSTTLNSLQDL